MKMVSNVVNRVDSESPHSCGHFDTKIEVVTIKNIRARSFPTTWTWSVIQSVESLVWMLKVCIAGKIFVSIFEVVAKICELFDKVGQVEASWWAGRHLVRNEGSLVIWTSLCHRSDVDWSVVCTRGAMLCLCRSRCTLYSLANQTTAGNVAPANKNWYKNLLFQKWNFVLLLDWTM